MESEKISISKQRKVTRILKHAFIYLKMSRQIELGRKADGSWGSVAVHGSESDVEAYNLIASIYRAYPVFHRSRRCCWERNIDGLQAAYLSLND